jgi:DDE superfamily endonuclease
MNYIVSETAPFLEKFFRKFDDLFNRPNQKEQFRQYCTGLLCEIKRKNIQGICEHTIESRYQGMHHFISESPWEARGLNSKRLNMLQGSAQTKSHAQGYFILDDTGNPKSGTATFATRRQYIGSVGKVDVGQVVVTSHYADSSKDYALDLEPYLPQKWVEEHNRQSAAAGLGEQGQEFSDILEFHPKWELGLSLVDKAQWVVEYSHILADGWYGNSPGFIEGLEQRQKLYITSLYQNRRVYYRLPGEPARNEHYLKDVVTALVGEELCFVRVGFERANGDMAEVFVREIELKIKNLGWRRVFICKPSAQELDLEQMDVLMTNDQAISLEQLVRAWSFRDRIDKFYECAKDNLGFDQYQVRSDRSIRRHWYLVFLMHSYLIYHRQKGSFSHWSKKNYKRQEKCSNA